MKTGALKIKKITVGFNEPVYGIGVVSGLTRIPAWTLRVLDRESIVTPRKSKGNTRLYSNSDLDKLCKVHYLMKVKKVNIGGLRLLKELKQILG